MPSSREIVLNLALSGDELKEIILADISRLLRAEGMLSSNAAFGKVAYTLALKLHLDNPFFPESLTRIDSQPATLRQVEDSPALASVMRPPLPSSATRSVGGTVIHRDIASPNVERVRLGIPVPVLVEQQDGTKTVERVKYPPEQAPVDDGMRVVDETEARRLGWNIIEVDE
jgi:hypothetical protein